MLTLIRYQIFVLFFFSLSFSQASQSLIRNTQNGSVLGKRTALNTEAFLGIPYAAPPVGDLRWKAPRPVQDWNGIYSAKTFSSACPQKGNFFANVPASQFGQPIGSEDCLYLNVWRPARLSTQEKVPVVFWIHGGSNFKGTSSDPMYDGAYLASASKVIFVSVNYRLGLLGAFSSEISDDEDKLDQSGNYVTLDLLQALRWVRDNVGNFGGDPNNITIMGQSAGCMNVWGLLQTPLSEGLFHKAVCSSGLPNAYPKMVARARAGNFIENLVTNAGLVTKASDASSFIKAKDKAWLKNFLYSRSVEEIVNAQDYTIPVQHIADGEVFPYGLEGAALGKFHHVPLILGSTLDEGSYLVGGNFLKPNAQELWGWIQNSPQGLTTEDFVATSKFAAFQAVTKAGSIAIQEGVRSIYLLAKLYNSSTYLYSFQWKETPSPWREVFGTVHGLDAVFYLGNFDTERENFARFAWTTENRQSREALRDRMNKDFTNFFWNGKPNWEGSTEFR